MNPSGALVAAHVAGGMFTPGAGRTLASPPELASQSVAILEPKGPAHAQSVIQFMRLTLPERTLSMRSPDPPVPQTCTSTSAAMR